MVAYVGAMCSYLMRHAVGSFRPILGSLHHWWQLQVLVILVIAFLPSIPLPGGDDLLVELHDMVHSLVGRRMSLPTVLSFRPSLLLPLVAMTVVLVIALHHHALMAVGHPVPRMTLSLAEVDGVKVV